jgi:hypothetical protein
MPADCCRGGEPERWIDGALRCLAGRVSASYTLNSHRRRLDSVSPPTELCFLFVFSSIALSATSAPACIPVLLPVSHDALAEISIKTRDIRN